MARRLPNPWFANNIITNTCVGTSVAIYTGWNYAHQGLAYRAVDTAFTSLQKSRLLPAHWHAPNPRKVREMLEDKAIHHTGTKTIDYEGAFFANFSHQSLTHLAFNVMAFKSFAPMLMWMPVRHYLGILFGSAVSSSAAFAYDHKNTPASGLGMSGIVSGVAMAATFFAPTSSAALFGIIRAPLWALTGGFFLLDTYLAQNGTLTGIGHSAHVGGALWGGLYYALFVRRYGRAIGGF